MRAWALALAAAAVLAESACKPAQTPPAAPAEDRTVQAPEPRQDLPDEQRAPDLFGAWLVQQVLAPDPLAQERSWDTILLVGVRQLEVISQCITVGPFEYGRTVGGGIAVSQTPVAPSRRGAPRLPPLVRCLRTLSPAERTLGPALLAAREVRRGDEGVSLSGPKGTLILRRPIGVLRNPRGQSPPPRMPPLIGAWRFVTVNENKLAPDQGIELLLRPKRLDWRSGCVNEVKALGSAGNRLIPGEPEPFPVCERGRSEAERAVGRLFSGPVVTQMNEEGRLLLQGSGVTAELEPLTR